MNEKKITNKKKLTINFCKYVIENKDHEDIKEKGMEELYQEFLNIIYD